MEIHFAGPAVRWLVECVAATAYPTPARDKSIERFLDELAAEGVKLFACCMARATWVRPRKRLSPMPVPPAPQPSSLDVDPTWRTLVF